MPEFDIRTAVLLGAVLTLVAGLLLAWVGRDVGDDVQRSLRLWVLSTLLQPIAFLLVALRGTIPDWLSIPVSNGLFAAAFALLALALRRFAGVPERIGVFVALGAFTVACSAWFSLIQVDPLPRMIVFAATNATIFALGAVALASPARVPGRGARFCFGVMLLGTVTIAIRGVYHVVTGDPTDGLMASSPIQRFTYATGATLPVLGTVGFLLMCAERQQRLLHRLSHEDPLTGALNRRGLERAAEPLLRSARSAGEVVQVLLVDLDHFKSVNDDHGHEAGDAALVEVARRLRAALPPEALFARLGGEEFVVLVRGGAPDPELAERLRQAVCATPVAMSGTAASLTASVGTSVLAAAEACVMSLLRRADHALYRAKRDGRDRVAHDVS